MIHQPVVGVGAVVVREEAVLLVQRGRPPAQGEWAIPGGRLQWGESLQQGAEREVLEECGVTIRAGAVIYHFENRVADGHGGYAYHYVVLDLAAEWLAGEVVAGDDAAAAAWVPFAELHHYRLNHQTRQALRQLYPAFTRHLIE